MFANMGILNNTMENNIQINLSKNYTNYEIQYIKEISKPL